MKGTLINTNTIEGFRNYDKKELIHSVGQQVQVEHLKFLFNMIAFA